MKPDPGQLFRYHGRSMWPCFQEGDLLAYDLVEPTRVRRGDCIAYTSLDGQLAVHRVVAVDAGWMTRGDALPSNDSENVTADRLIGRVTRRYRFGRCTAVSGGCRGRIAGLVYRYAGRIDPQRQTRGGRLARRLRTLCRLVLRMVGANGTAQRLQRQGEPDLVLWKLGKAYVGRKDEQAQAWAIAWPWSLLVEIREADDC